MRTGIDKIIFSCKKQFEGKMKRSFVLIAVMILAVLCAFGLSACGVDDGYTNLSREFVPFDEAAFVQALVTASSPDCPLNASRPAGRPTDSPRVFFIVFRFLSVCSSRSLFCKSFAFQKSRCYHTSLTLPLWPSLLHSTRRSDIIQKKEVLNGVQSFR